MTGRYFNAGAHIGVRLRRTEFIAAIDKHTNRKQSIAVQQSSGLSPEELAMAQNRNNG